jgi:hypothetical protein
VSDLPESTPSLAASWFELLIGSPCGDEDEDDGSSRCEHGLCLKCGSCHDCDSDDDYDDWYDESYYPEDDDTSQYEHHRIFGEGCRECDLIADRDMEAQYEEDLAEAMAASLPSLEDDGLDDEGLPVVTDKRGNPIVLRTRHNNRRARKMNF